MTASAGQARTVSVHAPIPIAVLNGAGLEHSPPIMFQPAPLPDDGSASLATVARLVGEIATDAKADGTLIAWSTTSGESREINRTGAMTRLAPGDCSRLLHDADNNHAVAGLDGVAWSTLHGNPETAMTAGVVAAAGGRLTAVVALHRPSASALLRIRRALARIAPILADYLAQALRLRAADERARGLAAAMNEVDCGVALLDGEGRPSFVNKALERLLDRRDGLKLNGNRFSTERLADTIRLQSAISHVLSDGDGPAPVVSVRRAGSERSLLVLISRPPQVGSDHAATLQVFDPDGGLQPLLEPVCRLYGLTPVEARLTSLLADGRSLAEAATAMRVRDQTARSYLKQIFLKTDTKRQAELVRLMLRSGIRSASACPISFY